MIDDGDIAMAAATFIVPDLWRIAQDGPRNTAHDRKLCQLMARYACRIMRDSRGYKEAKVIAHESKPASDTGDAR